MPIPLWWQNGVIYQIYPKSFQDITGSGTGDLRGVTQRPGYLQQLGVDAIWLTPFYISPQVDNGYDVANYTAIDPAYGTLDVYPNNWHNQSEQYYLHLFAPEQADLNWENPAVRAELKKVCKFWADRGVDGLRLDVVNLIAKHQDFPDDPVGDGRRFYTDGPRAHVFTPRNLMTVGEMSSTTLENCQQYAALNGNELSMTFNFHHLKVDYPGGEKWTLAKPDYVALKALFRHWQQGMHNVAWNALFWCNHD